MGVGMRALSLLPRAADGNAQQGGAGMGWMP